MRHAIHEDLRAGEFQLLPAYLAETPIGNVFGGRKNPVPHALEFIEIAMELFAPGGCGRP